MTPELRSIASRVVWWDTPERVLAREDDFLCRVMALADLADANYIAETYGADRLRRALKTASPGVIDVRSWHYWHHRLGLGPAGPMPSRPFVTPSCEQRTSSTQSHATCECKADADIAIDLTAIVDESLLDLAAQKVRVVQVRAERKDYLDLVTLLTHGISLPTALGAAQALYPDFAPLVTLKALSYFDDGDLGALPEEVKQTLLEAVATVQTPRPVRRLSDRLDER